MHASTKNLREEYNDDASSYIDRSAVHWHPDCPDRRSSTISWSGPASGRAPIGSISRPRRPAATFPAGTEQELYEQFRPSFRAAVERHRRLCDLDRRGDFADHVCDCFLRLRRRLEPRQHVHDGHRVEGGRRSAAALGMQNGQLVVNIIWQDSALGSMALVRSRSSAPRKPLPSRRWVSPASMLRH